MYVITFYSFKGGVGRTMALVNVAAELVRRGRRVLVVDFDLEAPGLETYKHLQPPRPHPGIVEYVTEYRRTHQVPNLLEYLYEAKPIGKKGGHLWVMPAGRRDLAYRNALVGLDWKRLYADQEGFLLFEDTKKGWEEELKPDYVLIDSRTGDTDVLGICTRQLPDSVVVMFTPNEQNLAGLENICRDIRREATEGLKKEIKLHFVAANVPDLDDENRVLHRQMQVFRKRLEFKKLAGVIRRYESLGLLDQSVFVLDRPHSRLAKSYRRLVRTLLMSNAADRDGALLFLQDYAKLFVPSIKMDMRSVLDRKHGDKAALEEIAGTANYTSTALEEGQDPLNEIAPHFLDDVDVMGEIAACRTLEGNFESAIRVLDRVLQLRPNDGGSLLWRSRCKTWLNQLDEAADDLLAYLRLPDRNYGVMDCLRKLRDIAPQRLSEAVDLLIARGGLKEPYAAWTMAPQDHGVEIPSPYYSQVSGHAQVAELLSTTDEGKPRAAQLLREYVKGLDENQHDKLRRRPWRLPGALLRARCWRVVIELLESRRMAELRPSELFQLALAYWGQSGEMPESLCRLALQWDEESKAKGWKIEELDPEVKSWLLWRVHKVPEALKFLEEAQHTTRNKRCFEAFSLWRLQLVSVGQYRDDCALVRRMIQGEPLRPAFLGPALSQEKLEILATEAAHD